jgi:hypothetical protein
MTDLEFLTVLIIILIVLGYFILRYLEGDLSIYKEEIIKRGNITENGKVIGTYYEIKREYQSGRVKIYVKDLK